MPIADVGDVKLHYTVRGEGDPVLGIMGFALDQRFWAAQVGAVTATHRFITFDNRGVGRSTGTVATSIEELANDTARLLDHLEIDRTVVFGVSMGGTVAQRLVLNHPDRVAALILAATWARPIEFMRRQHDVARTIIQASGVDGLIEISLLRMFTPAFFEAGRETIDRMVAAFMADSGPDPADAKVLLGQLDALDQHDALAELPQISCPTLVIGAAMDMMAPAFASEEIAATVPGARLEMFQTGHGFMVEEMEDVNATVQRFLKSL
jgi:aminoacrylate hydrolase